MKTLNHTLRLASVAACCAFLAACTSAPSRQADMDYRTRPPSTAQQAGPDGQRLTIQSGEGERLNLPWFIRDTQNAINAN